MAACSSARTARSSATFATEDPEELYFSADSQEHRDLVRDEKCPTCLSPCQMNVAAVKQVAPYAKFLVKAAREKRRFHNKVAMARTEPAALR